MQLYCVLKKKQPDQMKGALDSGHMDSMGMIFRLDMMLPWLFRGVMLIAE